MRGLKRNLREMGLRKMKQVGRDVSYEDPVAFYASASPAGGNVSREMFGTLTDYDYVVTSHDLDMDVGEDDLVVFEGNPHVIRRISRSLNVLSMAVRRVNISE